MVIAKAGKQITFSLPNKMGLAAEMASAFAASKVNVTAIVGYEMGDQAEFMVMVDDGAKAKRLLRKMGAGIKDENVIVLEMPNKVGELQKSTQTIADAGINIHYFYGTTGSGKTAKCVVSTSDNKKAIKILNK
ncbi:MAG TPA: ACT domain-containing protein [Dissulfurispiraceae bacterium]|nr:ACT domain-containing protein [Dissulfurispiraceae bacterium]